jgi:hypothetical protein
MTNITEDIRAFRTLLRQSDRPLETNDPFYVSDLHGTQAQDVVQRLFEDIQETPATGLYYFTGQRGTGKSTELLRLKGLVDGSGGATQRRCILLDCMHYLNDAQSISAELLMLMVAAGVDDWISAAYPEMDFTTVPWASRFRAWLKTEVELDKVALEMGPLKTHFNLKPSQAVVQEKIKKLVSRQQFHKDLIAFISEMCTWVQKREKREIVVVVDSLERLRGSTWASKEQDDIYEQVAQVFSDQLDMLTVPNLKLVYSVPPYLCLLKNVRDRVPLYALASVRVYEHPKKAEHKRKPRDSGLAHMRQLLSKRWSAWEKIFSPEAVDRFALLSGGDLRQFFLRILIDALVQAQYAVERLPMAKDDVIIDDIEAGCRIEMLQLTVRQEWPLMAKVAQSHMAIADDKIQLKTLAHLMEVKVILNYRNGSDWFDLHPALWSEIGGISLAENTTP